MGSDWSGMVSANSLPQEVRNRFASNMMLVESARRTPGSIPVGESRYSGSRGFYSEARQLVGGAASVTVNTLAVSSAGMLVGSRSDVNAGYGYQNLTPNEQNRLRFNEAFSQMMRGGLRIREAGPKAGFAPGFSDISAVGTNYSGKFSHQPGMRSGGRGQLYSLDGRPLGREVADTDDWLGNEEEETKVHDGSCASTHPGQSHSSWSSSSEEEERRERARMRETLKTKYVQAFAETNGRLPPVRESRGWKWCNQHQRWTRS